jgi:hypothetical protein
MSDDHKDIWERQADPHNPVSVQLYQAITPEMIEEWRKLIEEIDAKLRRLPQDPTRWTILLHPETWDDISKIEEDCE